MVESRARPSRSVQGRPRVATAQRTGFPEHGASPRIRLGTDDERPWRVDPARPVWPEHVGIAGLSAWRPAFLAWPGGRVPRADLASTRSLPNATRVGQGGARIRGARRFGASPSVSVMRHRRMRGRAPVLGEHPTARRAGLVGCPLREILESSGVRAAVDVEDRPGDVAGPRARRGTRRPRRPPRACRSAAGRSWRAGSRRNWLSAGFMSVSIGPGWTALTVMPLRAEVARPGPGEAADGELGRAVDPDLRQRHPLAQDAADVDDPPAGGQHPRRGPRRQERRSDVGGERPLEVVVGRVQRATPSRRSRRYSPARPAGRTARRRGPRPWPAPSGRRRRSAGRGPRRPARRLCADTAAAASSDFW